jgi:hypothetical protein
VEERRPEFSPGCGRRLPPLPNGMGHPGAIHHTAKRCLTKERPGAKLEG